MKTLLKTIVLAATLISGTAMAAGWGTDAKGGVNIVYGTSKDGYMLNAECNTNTDWPSWELYVYRPNGQVIDLQDMNKDPTVVTYIDGEKVPLYNPSTNIGMDAWNYFWKTLQQAKDKEITVVLDGGDLFKIPGNDLKTIFTGNTLRCEGYKK